MNKENIVKPGDVISAMGIRRTVKDIVYQDYWDGYYTVEGRDVNGEYFMWKQEFDGGRLIRK